VDLKRSGGYVSTLNIPNLPAFRANKNVDIGVWRELPLSCVGVEGVGGSNEFPNLPANHITNGRALRAGYALQHFPLVRANVDPYGLIVALLYSLSHIDVRSIYSYRKVEA